MSADLNETRQPKEETNKPVVDTVQASSKPPEGTFGLLLLVRFPLL